MDSVKSYVDLMQKIEGADKSFLLLYKSASQQSNCAYDNLGIAVKDKNGVPVYIADVNEVRDIHTQFGIDTVPSLLVFENGQYINTVKGCHDALFYKTLIDSAFYQAKAKAEGKTLKRVTVYSAPGCSWCNTLKAWLRKNGIPFSDIDVSRDERAAAELVQRTGQQGVPQTEINGQIVVGFDQPKLKELLEIT